MMPRRGSSTAVLVGDEADVEAGDLGGPGPGAGGTENPVFEEELEGEAPSTPTAPPDPTPGAPPGPTPTMTDRPGKREKESLLNPDTGQGGQGAGPATPAAPVAATHPPGGDPRPEPPQTLVTGPQDGAEQHLEIPVAGGSNPRGRSPSPGAGGSDQRRGRSRSPRGYGASGTITEIPSRSRSPTPTRDGFGLRGNSMHDGRGRYSLNPPAITYDEVSTAPNSPTKDGIMLRDIRMYGSNNQLHNKAVMMTPSGSLLAVNQSPLELRESTLTVNYPDCDVKVVPNGAAAPGTDPERGGDNLADSNSQDDDDDGDEVSLMYSRHEKIPMKDFSAEVRASMDVENFLAQAHLIMDLSESSVEGIVDKMLESMLKNEEKDPTETMEEAKKSLFTHDSVHQLAKTIQGTSISYGGGFDYDQSWITLLCTVPSASRRHVGIARLKSPANLGRTSQEVSFVLLVIAPSKEKGTKNALETGRTFATLFGDIDLRLQLLSSRTQEDFLKTLREFVRDLAAEERVPDSRKSSANSDKDHVEFADAKSKCRFAGGLRSDFKRRLGYYISDYKDGFCERAGFKGHRTIQKTLSTTFFLYFACILPSIALGVLNSKNTDSNIDVKKVIYAQTIGGLFFALVGGQPMVILLTTAPLALFTKVIYQLCEDWDLDFMAFYSCVGLWNSFFLIVYALSDASKLMKWSTRSTEEIFSLFISIAFTVDAFKDVYHNFEANYHSPACDGQPFVNASFPVTTESPWPVTDNLSYGGNTTGDGGHGDGHGDECLRANSLLFLLLTLGTVWLGLYLFNFTKTPFLNVGKREMLADYALPVAVLFMSFFGSYVFKDIPLVPFAYADGVTFQPSDLASLPWPAVFGAMGLGFCLSLLFFMDQNISGAMVNSPDNKLKKGPAYHWDLFVVSLLNGFLTIFGLPMMHGALPHSPLHVRAMADVEDRVDQGHIYQRVVYVRETRVTGVFSHVLVGLSIFLLPQPLQYIPTAVLDGLFLYLAVTALNNNQMFERIMLLFTEQSAYPPNHYIRTVPQRKIHLFTFLQLVQLGVLCGFGFSPMPYLKMVFPVLILLLLPIRHKLTPHAIPSRYLDALDGH